MVCVCCFTARIKKQKKLADMPTCWQRAVRRRRHATQTTRPRLSPGISEARRWRLTFSRDWMKKKGEKKKAGGGPFLLCVSFLLELLCLWFSTRIVSGSVVVGRARPTEHQTNKRNKNENISYPTACCRSRVVLSHRCGCGCSYRVPGSSDGLISNDNRVISNDLFGCCRTIIGFDTISITGTEFDTISTNDAGRLIEHQV